jgi:hypothetical protein
MLAPMLRATSAQATGRVSSIIATLFGLFLRAFEISRA